jgi:hypothetical protein
MRWSSGSAAVVFVTAAAFGVARADVIDGAWCRDPGQRLTIDGPSIVTPGGTATRGAYSRHFFSYVVPAGEAGAGGTVEMRLLNEDTMQRRTGPAAPIETWRRCSPAVSQRATAIAGG